MWDPEIKKSSIDGEFKPGATGYLKPLSGPKNRFVVTDVIQDKLFTVRIKLPLCTMYFEHELIPQSTGTEVLNRIVFNGLLAPVFGKLIENKLKKEQSRTMLALKKKLRMKNNSGNNIFSVIELYLQPKQFVGC